jgi:hypothetical protein
MKFIAITAGIVLCVLLTVRNAQAVTVPDYIKTEIIEAQLQGHGLLTWFGLKIYSANLWVSKKNSSAPSILNQHFALELHYLRKLEGAEIAKVSIEEIKRLNIGTDAQQASWLRSMKSLFPNVDKGSRLTGIHLPGEATRFYRDGKLLGEIADPEFGPAFFSIWLDTRTREPALRHALLGTK